MSKISEAIAKTVSALEKAQKVDKAKLALSSMLERAEKLKAELRAKKP